ncbi:hypothetical protein GCM10027418_02760 [Mariniluteicoccus endophyticus]
METWQLALLALFAMLLIVSVFNIVRILLAMRKPVPTTYAAAPAPVAETEIAPVEDEQPLDVTTTDSAVFARPQGAEIDAAAFEEAEHAADEPVIEDSDVRPTRAAD